MIKSHSPTAAAAPRRHGRLCRRPGSHRGPRGTHRSWAPWPEDVASRGRRETDGADGAFVPGKEELVADGQRAQVCKREKEVQRQSVPSFALLSKLVRAGCTIATKLSVVAFGIVRMYISETGLIGWDLGGPTVKKVVLRGQNWCMWPDATADCLAPCGPIWL